MKTLNEQFYLRVRSDKKSQSYTTLAEVKKSSFVTKLFKRKQISVLHYKKLTPANVGVINTPSKFEKIIKKFSRNFFSRTKLHNLQKKSPSCFSFNFDGHFTYNKFYTLLRGSI